MNPNRKAAQDYLLKNMSLLDKSGENTKMYEGLFAKMSNKDFDKYVKALEDGKAVVALYVPPLKTKITIRDLLDASKKLGVELFERIKIYDDATDSYYTTSGKYLVLEVPVRRMAQFVDHKLSVSENDTKIDILTGQVVQEDKAASLSQVEVQTMYARNLKNTITELLKQRGGDVIAFGEYKRELEETGIASLKTDVTSKPRSAVVMDVFMSGMHIESNASGV